MGEALAHQRLGVSAESKLQLLEAFVASGEDVAAQAQRALEWLEVHAGISSGLLALSDAGRTALTIVAAVGVRRRSMHRMRIPLGTGSDPLAAVLRSGRPRTMRCGQATRSATRQLLDRFFEADALAIPVGGFLTNDLGRAGLLLVSPAREPLTPTVRWFVEMLSHQLAQMLGRGTPSEQERQLRRERTLLYRVLNAVTDPILLTDTEGRLLLANNRAELLFSMSDNISDGRRRAIELNNMFFSAALSRTVLGEGDEGRRELALVDPADGSDLLFELLSAVVNDPREGTGVVSVLRNISDLRRATLENEETYVRLRTAEAHWRAERDRLNLIIDSVADPIIVTDDEGKISLMNARAERLFTMHAGFGESAQPIVQANDASFTLFVSGLLSTGGEATRRGEIALADPETGRPVPVEAIAGKVLSSLGELTAIVTILHDRTEAIERAQLYEQLKEASNELEGKVRSATAELNRQNELLRRQALELVNASAAKSQFLANVSHELRTPLNAVLGYAAVTQQGVSGPLTEGQQRNLQRIEANGRHLLMLIDEILDITRIEAGRMPVQIAEFEVAHLLQEVLVELEPIINRSKLTVITAIDPELPALKSDRQKVKQVLVNLLSNAVKFTAQGSLVIDGRMEDGAYVALSVTDTGIGIAEADQAAIFDDFRQVDSTPRRAYGGTGLGLAICRRLATILRGNISVRSELGCGSTFTLRLPVELAE